MKQLKFRIRRIRGYPSIFGIQITLFDISKAFTPWVLIYIHTWHIRFGWFEWTEKKEG